MGERKGGAKRARARAEGWARQLVCGPRGSSPAGGHPHGTPSLHVGWTKVMASATRICPMGWRITLWLGEKNTGFDLAGTLWNAFAFLMACTDKSQLLCMRRST